MDEKKVCRHKRFVKWFPQAELPVYRKIDGDEKRLGHSKTLVFYGCLDCGKVIVEDYGD